MTPPIPPKTLADLIDLFSDVFGGLDVMKPGMSVVFVMFIVFSLAVVVVEVAAVSSDIKIDSSITPGKF